MEKLYELTDKGRARLKELRGKHGELWNVRHEEPTNYEHCCSCCPLLEQRVRERDVELADKKARIEELEKILLDETYGCLDDICGEIVCNDCDKCCNHCVCPIDGDDDV